MEQLNLRKDDVDKLYCAKEILEKEYRSHYTADQLAQKVGTNEYKLKCGFKQLFNTSPYKFLTTIRIEKAKGILECTELPVKSVATRVGIPDVPTFIKCFKRNTGVCPGEWRKGRKYKLAGDLYKNPDLTTFHPESTIFVSYLAYRFEKDTSDALSPLCIWRASI